MISYFNIKKKEKNGDCNLGVVGKGGKSKTGKAFRPIIFFYEIEVVSFLAEHHMKCFSTCTKCCSVLLTSGSFGVCRCYSPD